MTDPNLTPQILQQQITAEAQQVDVTQTAARAQQSADNITTLMDRQTADTGGEIRELAIDQKFAAQAIPIATAGSGGYAVTPAEIQLQLTKCTEILARFQTTYRSTAQRIADTTPPALDQIASVPQAEATIRFGGRTIELVDNQIKFLTTWQTTLQSAKQRYIDQEHLTESDWDKIAQGHG